MSTLLSTLLSRPLGTHTSSTPCVISRHLGRILATVAFAAASFAQGVDPVLLTDRFILDVAADSKGAAVVLQQTSGTEYGVYRYDSAGHLLQAYTDVVDSSTLGSPGILALDSNDNIYLAGVTTGGDAHLLRVSGPAGSWHAAIDGVSFTVRAVAFDPKDNPILLGFDGGSRVVKLDRGSGAILADYHFDGPYGSVNAMTADAAGSVYITGWTVTADGQQCFLMKLDPALRERLSYFVWGGAALTFPQAVAVAADGSAYVAGVLLGTDFPVTAGAFQTTVSFPRPIMGGVTFVSRIAPDGLSLTASTFLSGSYGESATDVRIDRNGNVVVAGTTMSRDFPATGVWTSQCGPARRNNQFNDTFHAIFVTVLDASLSKLQSSARIPQTSLRNASALLPDGSLYVSLWLRGRILRVSPSTPSSPVACVVNGASFLSEDVVAPGQLLTIFGMGLGPDPLLAFDSSQQLPVSAGGTEVRIGGISAPLLAVAESQINAIVPFGVAGQVPVEIYRDSSVIYRWQVDVVPRNPTPLLHFEPDGSVPLYQFWYNSAYLPLADAVNEDGTANSAQNPARWGSVITIYATGFGQMTPALSDGAPGGASAFEGASFRTVGGDAPVDRSYPVLSVQTIAGRTNAVVAVKVQLPAGPLSPQVEFRLGPPDSPDARATNVIYTRE